MTTPTRVWSTDGSGQIRRGFQTGSILNPTSNPSQDHLGAPWVTMNPAAQITDARAYWNMSAGRTLKRDDTNANGNAYYISLIVVSDTATVVSSGGTTRALRVYDGTNLEISNLFSFNVAATVNVPCQATGWTECHTEADPSHSGTFIHYLYRIYKTGGIGDIYASIGDYFYPQPIPANPDGTGSPDETVTDWVGGLAAATALVPGATAYDFTGLTPPVVTDKWISATVSVAPPGTTPARQDFGFTIDIVDARTGAPFASASGANLDASSLEGWPNPATTPVVYSEGSAVQSPSDVWSWAHFQIYLGGAHRIEINVQEVGAGTFTHIAAPRPIRVGPIEVTPGTPAVILAPQGTLSVAFDLKAKQRIDNRPGVILGGSLTWAFLTTRPRNYDEVKKRSIWVVGRETPDPTAAARLVPLRNGLSIFLCDNPVLTSPPFNVCVGTGANVPVTATLASNNGGGTNPGPAAVLGGTTTRNTDANGFVEFDDLTVSNFGFFKITFSSPGLTSCEVDFQVSPLGKITLLSTTASVGETIQVQYHQLDFYERPMVPAPPNSCHLVDGNLPGGFTGVGFATPILGVATFFGRFTAPGTFNLFCSGSGPNYPDLGIFSPSIVVS